jgi:GSH-dependent disulfide-bond oxidoreductase
MGSRRSASGNPTWRKKQHSAAKVQKAAKTRPFAFIPLRAGSVAIAFVVDLVGPSPVRRLAYQRFPASDVPRFIRKVRIQNVIDLYTWTTPNGRKVSIALEELGLPYTVHPIDISKDEQFAPEFLKIAPNNRIPAIVDRDTNIALMESGAILIYLADKTGKLLPKSGEGRYRVIEWLMWQMGGPGPMLGQVHHFVKYNKGKAPYAEERYLKEAHRLYRVLNTRLEGREFVADQYSIADIAIWPWISRFEWQTIDMKQYPNVKRWYETIAAHPTVQKGYKVPKDMGPVPMP